MVCHFGGWDDEIYKGMSDVYDEACFSQNIFTIDLNIGLSLQTWVEMRVHRVDTHWLSSKETVLGLASSKESHSGCLVGHERIHHFWFSWKIFD